MKNLLFILTGILMAVGCGAENTADIEAFKTKHSNGKVSDIMGNEYKTVIYSQGVSKPLIWMAENLNTMIFSNGDTIPELKNSIEWFEADKNGKPGFCHYDNDSANGTKYGKIYNWHAVTDERGLAPVGWKIPAQEDWENLRDYIKNGTMEPIAKVLKSKSGWFTQSNGTNESGFSAIPAGVYGGYEQNKMTFRDINSYAGWWSSTRNGQNIFGDHPNTNSSVPKYYLYENEKSLRYLENWTKNGFYVRCIKK